MEQVNNTVDNSTTAVPDLTENAQGRLVLVGSCQLKNIKQEVGEEKVSFGESLEWVKGFCQQLKDFYDPNNPLSQLGKLQDTICALTVQMEILTSQMRDMQLLFLKSSLSSQTSSPGSCEINKVENLFKPQDQVFQTPKKSLEQPGRLDVTPVSTLSEMDQQNGSSSTAVALVNSRRSLAFPKSLEAMLDDTKKENCTISDNGSRDVSMVDGPTPTLSLVDVKTEPGSDESPYRDSKLGLLVLADAALTHSPNQSTFAQGGMAKDPLFSEYDSGRSSGNSCRSSPSSSQEELKIKAEKFVRYGASFNSTTTTTRGIHVSIPSKSGFSSSSSSTSSADQKLRKRRKTKQPLPCNFCGKCFNNQSSLRQHESFHRPIRPFKCENEKCDKAYKTRSELNRHLVVHSGEKKHECKLCGKRFLRKQYLKTHLLRHHETGLAMVAPSAMESFKDDSTGTIPSIVVSSSFVSKTEPLTWRCQMCSKIFVNNEDLLRHVRSYHAKKKPMEGKIVDSTEGGNRMDEGI